MKRKNFINWAFSLCLMGLADPVSAQVVKNERLFSFEDGVPAQMKVEASSLAISDVHYKDGTHSLRWTYQPGATLALEKDLKFEEKDPTGKDTYLSAFIVWVYNEKAVDKKITFQFLKDGKVCTSFPFGINFTGWRAPGSAMSATWRGSRKRAWMNFVCRLRMWQANFSSTI